jgi:hypothetical protein
MMFVKFIEQLLIIEAVTTMEGGVLAGLGGS